MSVTPKTIYLEADEEVTSVIDKIRKTEFAEVVLVVPKDASISQSVVNLKLIKRKAEELNKGLSIVTQDKVARNLAGKVGIATAAKANEVPQIRTAETKEESTGPLEETNEVIFDDNPVIHEPEELTVTEGEDVHGEVEMHEEVDEKVAKYEKSLLPKFPWKWVGLVGAIVLGGLLLAGYIYLPRAKATIFVAAEKKPLTLNFNGEKDAKLDTEKVIIPTQVIEVTKEENKKYPATGKKEVGTKATGIVRISNNSGSKIDWVSGTRFAPKTSMSIVYRATSAISVEDGAAAVNVPVEAVEVGEQYNGFGSSQSFTTVAISIPDTITIICKDGMTGGTKKEITIVSQGDVNSAKDALAKELSDSATAEFNEKSSELKIIEDTKKSEVVSATASPDVNSEGTEFTLSLKVSVKALGFSLNDISSIVTSEVDRQLGSVKQIIDDGAKSAEITVDSSDLETGKISGSIKTNAFVSTKIDEDAIKIEVSGLNNSKATNYLLGVDGVDDVEVVYWPSFIKSFPRIKNHIFLTVEVADSSRN